MMPFNETGLPLDPTVFKAFAMFSKEIEGAKKIPGEEINENFAVRVAQLLNETGNKDSKLLSLALLNVMPPQTYGIVEKQFGREMTDLMNEAGKHSRTSYAYINEAGETVKLFTLAAAVATFETFHAEAEKAEEMLQKMADGQPPANGRLMLPIAADSRVYDRLAEVLFDKTTSPALEELFRDRLSSFKNDNDRLKSRIIEMGLASELPPQIQMKLNSPDSASYRYPAFEDTGLLDTPKVRAAYDVIVSHPLASPEGFEAALEVGKLLTDKVEDENPTAVATGLMMTALQGLSKEDFEFLDKKIDWDVTDIMKQFASGRPVTMQSVAQAPAEFKLALLANTVTNLGHMKDGIAQLKDMLAQQEEIPEKMRPIILAQNLQQMMMMTESFDQTRRLIGKTSAPELEAMFKDLIREVRAEIVANMPASPRRSFNDIGFPEERNRAAPDGKPTPPKPGKPKHGGQSFDL
ncbi:MAG TPA: hypothetical protein VEF76_12785 [Patescibacteria group bacterium]|nr:hypothetical protein [Patescibacteria group bacterium]